MGNPFVHVELHSSNVQKSREFYKSLLDWEYEEFPMPDFTYYGIKVGEGTGGGMMAKQAPPEVPDHWLAYIQVDDIKATTDKAASLGGTVLVSCQPIPEMGTFSVIQDPTGAAIAFWENVKKE